MQGTPSDSYRYRRNASLSVGWEHIIRDGTLLAALVCGTLLAQAAWKSHRKQARRRSRAKREPPPFEHGGKGIADFPMNRRRRKQIRRRGSVDQSIAMRLVDENCNNSRSIHDHLHT